MGLNTIADRKLPVTSRVCSVAQIRRFIKHKYRRMAVINYAPNIILKKYICIYIVFNRKRVPYFSLRSNIFYSFRFIFYYISNTEVYIVLFCFFTHFLFLSKMQNILSFQSILRILWFP